MAKRRNPKNIETLTHSDATRKNIPTAEYQSVLHHEQADPIRVAYERRNRDLDPQLVWRGKDEQDWSDLVVQAPPLYIQEKIHPKALIDDLAAHGKTADETDPEQLDLFADFNGVPDEADKTDFYQHDQNWTNRMILGDSLQVMASLAEREGLRGQVQCIYLDPPYGIKFNSNFQWSTTSRTVRDGKTDHITREPEQVKAFRDTWRDGIHSYLTYLRDRLTVARDLLTESGSIFVQIGDENVHRVRALMDEVFGDENFIAQVTFRVKSPLSVSDLARTTDFLIWYAKSKPSLKFRQPRAPKLLEEHPEFTLAMLSDGTTIPRREAETTDRTPIRFFTAQNLGSSGYTPSCMYEFSVEGRTFNYPKGKSWKTNLSGMTRLAKSARLQPLKTSLRWRYFFDDAPSEVISDIWSDTFAASDKIYVVQTSESAIQRCVLMTTDPGDLVLDPTCVRKGTLVLVPVAPFGPPACGGMGRGTSMRTGAAAQSTAPSPLAGRAGEGQHPPAPAGRAGEGQHPPAPAGRTGEGKTRATPIEQLQPGDWVYTHDGHYHRVVRTLKRTNSGEMFGIKREGSSETLWVTADHLVLSQRRVDKLSKDGGWSAVPTHHFDRAKKLRKEMTMPERILWQKLKGKQLGVKFRRQHPIGPYIADFYTRDAGLVIEVDGGTHSATPEAIAYDQERDRFMESMGLRVLRFTASDVTRSPWSVAEAIAHACREHVLPDDASKQWRFAKDLQIGDLVYCGVDQKPQRIVGIETQTTTEEVYDLEVEDAHSFITTTCTVHNCGSGTTAYVAEQWGRRWITVDTSRVALALARARIMGARYPYYLLADSREGQRKEAELSQRAPSSQPTYGNIRHGFVYERVPHIMLKDIANNAEIDVIWERWQPKVEAALAALNEALRGHAQPFAVTTGGRAGKQVRFDTPEDATFTMPSGETVPAFALVEWEVPREKPEDWPAATEALLADFWSARIGRQKEIDASIAAKSEFETLYDKPYEDRKTVRVAGPFTVESLSPHRVLGVDENDELIDPLKENKASYGAVTSFPEMVLENLKTAGVQQAHKENKINFSSLVPWPGELICAEGRYREGGDAGNNGAGIERRAAIFIGPEFGTVQRADLVQAAREAGDGGFDVLIACAFAYEAHTTDFSKLGRLSVLKARMNADLHMANDLKNTGKGNLFVVFGEPDVKVFEGRSAQLEEEINRRNALIQEWDGNEKELKEINAAIKQTKDAAEKERLTTEKERILREIDERERYKRFLSVASDVPKDQCFIELWGVDVFHPSTGEVRSDDTDGIACWFVDTDYNEESFFVRHAYFLGANDPYKALKTTLKAEIDKEAWSTLNSDISRPFPRPASGRIAVKVINHLGDEVMKVFRV